MKWQYKTYKQTLIFTKDNTKLRMINFSSFISTEKTKESITRKIQFFGFVETTGVAQDLTSIRIKN